MDLCRSQRTPKPVTIWEEKNAPSAAKDPKITKKSTHTKKKTALKPIAVGPLPNVIKLDENWLPELPTYIPLLELRYQASKLLATGLSELDTFQKLLTPSIIEEIIEATNSYAQNAQINDEDSDSHTWIWKTVNSTDIWRYIEYLLYMEYHKKERHKEHWIKEGHLKKFMSLKRYKQIHWYLTL